MKEAFIDESVRGDRYIICETLVPQSSLAETRKDLRLLLQQGQRRIHFNNEKDRNRRMLLTAFSEMEVSSVIYSVRHRDFQVARTAILREVVSEIKESRVVRLVLESRDIQDAQDKGDILRALRTNPIRPFTYVHLFPSSEPLLWVPDAVAWSWGRGGDWRRRVGELGLVERVEEVEVP